MRNNTLHILLVFIALFSVRSSFGQEEVGPIMINPQLYKGAADHQVKANTGTFDSTFIYISDTLVLPIFDDFSANKFQTYNANYSDAGVTFDKQYRLLDLGSTPLPNDVLYTQQQTFRRTFDIGNGTSSDTYFSPTQIQLGDLSAYPVSYQTIDAYPPYYIYDTLDYPNDPDTIWIPDAEIFQDSATQFFAPVSDQQKIWLDSYAFHNYTMAYNPWSIGVATFDGLDENGFPYAIGTTTSGPADYLTSKPIDMSGVSSADSVYFSFLYQAQGLCDAPEAGDSLYLQFYEKGTDQWNDIWTGGSVTADTSFDFAHILIDSSIYFNDYFQFRFYNRGGLSGSLDHYHLDYVNVRALSGYQDTLFKDYALVYPVNSLLKDYTSVPWDHYKNNFSGKMSDAVRVVIRNGSNIAENNSLNGSVDVSYSGTPEGSFTLLGPNLSNGSLNYAPRTTYYSYHDFSAGYHYDETKTGDEEIFDFQTNVAAQFPNFTGNDSLVEQQVFSNYYSYDDGSAELSYGPTGSQSELAVQYTPYEADSVIGAMIHFLPSVDDVSNKLFLLTLWDDNGGEPGAVLYQDDVFFPRQPVYEYDRNIFRYYFFQDTMKVHVDGTFYIGWKQLDPDRLGVGLDMNIPNGDKTFISTVASGFTWDQSQFNGSVMIRPIFSTTLDPTLGFESTENRSLQTEVRLVPNPASTSFKVDLDGVPYQGVQVVDLSGKEIITISEKQIDVTNWQSGVYLVRVIGTNQTVKLLKQ
jgi:hypothetical protein